MSLYNDERPQSFVQVLGQDRIVSRMKRKLAQNQFSQTNLLIGPRGTGKTTCARIIAKALNCENISEDGEPCCKCGSCLAIAKGTSPSVLELDAATNNGVEDVRALTDKVQYAPVGKNTVIILDEIHMFSNSAWNALLKTLEEPPENTYFIMATTETAKVPATVLSRCSKYEFTKISRQVMENYIYDLCAKYEIGAEPAALSLIVTQAEGCMRDALSLLEQFTGCDTLEAETVMDFLGIPPLRAAFDVLSGMITGDIKTSIAVVENQESRGRSILLLTKGMLEALNYTLALKAGAELSELSREYLDYLKDLSALVSDVELAGLMEDLLKVYPVMQKAPQMTFYLKSVISGFVSRTYTISRLSEEVENLKQKTKVIPLSVSHSEAYEDAVPDIGTTQTVSENMAGSVVPFPMEKSAVKQQESSTDTSLQDTASAVPDERTDGKETVSNDGSDADKGVFVDGEAMGYDELLKEFELMDNPGSEGSTPDIHKEDQKEFHKTESAPSFAAFEFFFGGCARQ